MIGCLPPPYSTLAGEKLLAIYLVMRHTLSEALRCEYMVFTKTFHFAQSREDAIVLLMVLLSMLLEWLIFP